MALGILILLGIVGSFAWFSTARHVKSLTYVGKPSELIISEGNRTDTTVINVGEIDITANTGSHDFVFSVHGNVESDDLKYDIQLVHTTNLPFQYEIFKASEDLTGSISYYNEDTKETTHFTKQGKLDGKYLNTNKGQSGYTDNNAYISGSKVHIDAYPSYWLNTTSIEPTTLTQPTTQEVDVEFRDYYVLTVSWNKVENNAGEKYTQNIDKETDMIYLLAEGVFEN